MSLEVRDYCWSRPTDTFGLWKPIMRYLYGKRTYEYRKRIDGLFEALTDEQTRLEASDDIRALVGKVTVSPREGDKADLWLEGDLAGILTLAAGKKTPAQPGDEQVLLALGAGMRNPRNQQNERTALGGAANSEAPEVLCPT